MATQYDIDCIFSEMVRNGHTKFHFTFRLANDRSKTFEDFYYEADAQMIIDNEELVLYNEEGVEEVWIPIDLE